MQKSKLSASLAVLALVLAGVPLSAAAADKPAAASSKAAAIADTVAAIDIPYEQFTLDNGLTVLVHTDRKAPIVGVTTYYRVGSKNEPKGKTGFAHLFEHLMFGGSENVPNFDEPLEAAGSTPTNGSTWLDRTNYVETVPTGALDLALFMESDRMGHLLGAVTQEKLDQQRGVVQNEKRQGDNQPYAIVEYEAQDALFPVGHPYRHSTIGSMADLNSASLADVKKWFTDNYGPNNAVLVLAGDIDAATAKPKVERWFGDIPAGPPIAAVEAPVPTLDKPFAKTITDQVATTRLYRNWAVPGLNDPSYPALATGMYILGGLASSRLDNLLVRKEQLAVAVTAYLMPFQHASMVQSYIDVKPGVDVAKAEARYDAILADFIAKGPTQAELDRAVASLVSAQVGQLEQVGGFGGKGATLAEGLVFSGNPEKYKQDLAALTALTPAAVQGAMQTWLTRPVAAIRVDPGERTEGGESRGGWEKAGSPRIGYYRGADADEAAPAAAPATPAAAAKRSFPPVEPVGSFDFPAIERATLANGIPVYFAKRSAVPKVTVSLSFDAGFAADAPDARGTQSFMAAMLEEGTKSRDAIAIAEEQERLGASINVSAGLDSTTVSLDTLTSNLAPSLALMADIVRAPAFAPAEVERVRGQRLAGIAQEENSPMVLAMRALPPLLYGPGHPYGAPLTGTGSRDVVARLTPADLAAAHAASFRPDKARIIVVGDVDEAAAVAALDSVFGHWVPPATPAVQKDLSVAIPAARQRIVLIDRPGAPQSVIAAGQVLPETGKDRNEVLQASNEILGNGFLSRLNMNLRETKGWSYGVRSTIQETEGPMPHIVRAPVQSDRTGDAIAEMLREMRDYPTTRGATPVEVNRIKEGNIRGLPNRFETRGQIAGGIDEIVRFGRPDDYYETLPAIYGALTAATLNAAAAKELQPGHLVIVVVGDARTVKPQLAKLGLPVEEMAAPKE